MSEPRNPVSTKSPLVFGPIGCCIYCRSTAELSREHVMPFALGGGVILLEASCANCRKLTQKFEEAYLKNDLGIFRAQANFPTGKKKHRPTHKLIKNDATGDAILADINEWPMVLPVVDFKDPPGAVNGVAPSAAYYKIRPLMRVNDERWAKARERFEGCTGTYEFHGEEFIQMLAKIAHGLVFATCDSRDIEPLLLPIILDGNLEQAGFVIGGSDVELMGEKGDHAYNVETFRISDGRFLTGVRLRLFLPVRGSPTYLIIAGISDCEPRITYGAHLPKPGGRERR